MRLPLARKKVPCHDRVCAFPNIRIEEFTSPLSEHKYLPSTSFWLNVTSHALSRFRSTGWSNFVTSRRTASRLLSAVRPSTRIQCPCKANGGSGTAVNYPLYTALDLEPIFNDLSNLARGEKRGKGGTHPPALRQEAPKIHGGHEDHETTSMTTERTGSKTKRRCEIDQGGFYESFDIPTFPPRSSWGYPSPFVFVSRRADSPACTVLYFTAKCVRIANACNPTKHVERRRQRFDRNRARIPQCEL